YLLQRGSQHELARVQHEHLPRADLNQPCQVRLLDRRIDVGILVVLEHPEETVEPDVDAGRLDKTGIEGVDPDTPGVDLGPEVTIRQKHVSYLPLGFPSGPVPVPGG